MNKAPSGSQTLLRTLNARAILEALARRGPLTRAELMGETGLSRTAVTQVLRMLEAGEAVASAGVDRATHGPAATRVSLSPRWGCAAAVQIDHHSVHVALVDIGGAVRAERSAEFILPEERADLVRDLVDACRGAAPIPLIAAVVGVPGVVTESGGIRDDQGPDGGALQQALAAKLGCPVRIENDVNLAAIAESTCGAGAELSSFALLLLDDGLGAGLMIDGVLRRGASGLAGEVQFLPQPGLPIAAPVLGDKVVADLALAHGRDPAAPLSVHLDACAAGDPAAERMVAEMARRFTYVAGSIALILDPDAFVLGGDALHPVFFDAVRRLADGYSALLTLRFLTSVFGKEATLVGAQGEAVALLRDRLFDSILTPSGRTAR